MALNRVALLALLCAGSGLIGLPLAEAQQTATLTSLYSFSASQMGSAGLVLGSDGNFYGTTYGNPETNEYGNPVGTPDYGSVFQITPAGVFTILHSFSGTDGDTPSTTLVQGSNGNFYGTTLKGGASFVGSSNTGSGTVFQITPAGVFTTLHSFNGTDGSGPNAALVQGSDGNFYGTTLAGGTGNDSVSGNSGLGTVFRITPAGVFTTLYNFSGADGDAPYSPLVQGSDGNFYGTTELGGSTDVSPAAPGDGTVFQITPAGVLTVLHDFNASVDGSAPDGFTLGSDGNFYGTTRSGGLGYDYLAGNIGYGTVFQITLAGVFTTLHSFTDGSDGSHPRGNLFQANDGNFYGTTGGGGTLFEISSTGAFTTLYTSTGSTVTLGSGVVQGRNGEFYGVSAGGPNTGGTIFELTVSAHPAFFTGEVPVGSGVYYLAFPNGNYFGYYSFLADPSYLYHFDLGYEYVFDANDGQGGVYLYDFASSDFFYTSPTFPFPYLYDFSLQSVLYYYPDTSTVGHYTSNPRYFYEFATEQIISK